MKYSTKNIKNYLFCSIILLCFIPSAAHSVQKHSNGIKSSFFIPLTKAENVLNCEDVYLAGTLGMVTQGIDESDLSFNSKEDGSLYSYLIQRKNIKSIFQTTSLNKIKFTFHKTFLSDFFPRI